MKVFGVTVLAKAAPQSSSSHGPRLVPRVHLCVGRYLRVYFKRNCVFEVAKPLAQVAEAAASLQTHRDAFQAGSILPLLKFHLLRPWASMVPRDLKSLLYHSGSG